jgi:uncharacterized protein (DUF58 family)
MQPGHLRSRHLQITASRLATGIFAGEYRSAFRGRGIGFDQVRAYQPGDEVRSVDRNVTARLGTPFVKDNPEARELTVVLVVDRSPSMQFGTSRCTKLETATEASALLAFAAARSHDRTALLSVGDRTLHYLPPGKGEHHTMRLLQDSILPPKSGRQGGGLASALSHLDRVLKGRCVVCVLSDFVDPIPAKPLASLAARHDVVAMNITDPAEVELPDSGLVTFHDPRTGAACRIDSSDPTVREAFREVMVRRLEERRAELLQAGSDYLSLSTEVAPVQSLTLFFRERRQRSRP